MGQAIDRRPLGLLLAFDALLFVISLATQDFAWSQPANDVAVLVGVVLATAAIVWGLLREELAFLVRAPELWLPTGVYLVGLQCLERVAWPRFAEEALLQVPGALATFSIAVLVHLAWAALCVGWQIARLARLYPAASAHDGKALARARAADPTGMLDLSASFHCYLRSLAFWLFALFVQGCMLTAYLPMAASLGRAGVVVLLIGTVLVNLATMALYFPLLRGDLAFTTAVRLGVALSVRFWGKWWGVLVAELALIGVFVPASLLVAGDLRSISAHPVIASTFATQVYWASDVAELVAAQPVQAVGWALAHCAALVALLVKVRVARVLFQHDEPLPEPALDLATEAPVMH